MLIIDKDEVSNAGNISIFYDENSADHVTIANATLSSVEWAEVPGEWPSGL